LAIRAKKKGEFHWDQWHLWMAVLSALLLLWTGPGCRAVESAPKELRYYYRISRFPATTPDSAWVHFDFAIPYSRMVFVFRDSLYEAFLRFNLFVLDRDQNLVFEKNWKKRITVESYYETLSDSTFWQFATVAPLPAGKYEVVMESLDENVEVPQYKRLTLRIRDRRDRDLVLGDMLFLEGRYDFTDVDLASLTPAPKATMRRDFTVYSEVLLLKGASEVTATLTWSEGYREVRSDTLRVVRQGKKLKLFRIYSIKELDPGEYEVELVVEGRGIRPESVQSKIEILKHLEFYSEEALDRAIEQLRYIGEGAAYDSLLKAKTFERKKYWFNRFWMEYYPVEDSLNNPVREEYYRRVRYANRHFGSGREGWRTDRGRIFILYGPPDEIRRTQDRNLREYEIWIYNEIQRQFVFVRDQSIGEYRLIREM